MSVLRKRRRSQSKARIKGVVRTRCYRKGDLVWEDVSENIIVNTGLDYLIDVALGGSGVQAQIATWFVGLLYQDPTVLAAHTPASHAGWTEVTVYSAAARPEFKDLDNGTGSRDNDSTTAVAAFTLESSLTCGGVILVSTNTKAGTAGTLFSGVAFTGGNRPVQTNDRLEVTYTISVADDAV